MLLALLSAAFAATVAVLPLDQAAGGDPYAGLGVALAGMLTTDLSVAPGVTLVERARLDAVTGEIALGKGGYVDPATAQRLGKGLGASFVVVGSYSVVGETFLLDARLVNVATGTVAKAAAANGEVARFVDVEKVLVGQLLDGMEVKLAAADTARLARAPTRSFSAFSAYGAGLAAQRAGDVEAARRAYAAALTADPAYAAPTDALGSLRVALDAAQAERARSKAGARAAVLDAVLTRFPEPTTRDDPRQLAGFVLRLLALREQGRDCERYAELRRFLDTARWRPSLDPDAEERVREEALTLAVSVGLTGPVESDPSRYHELERRIGFDGTPIFRSPAHYFYAFPTLLADVEKSPDLTTALTKCLTGPEAVVELARLSAQARAFGVGGATLPDAPVALAERLEWTMIAVRARTTGIDAGMASRMTSLIALEDDVTPRKTGGTARAWVEKEARRITDAARLLELAEAAKLGWREEAVAASLAALSTLDAGRVAVKDADCKASLSALQPWATAAAAGPVPKDAPARLTALRDLGCFVGTPARFAAPQDAVVYVAGAPARVRPENAADPACVAALAELPTHLEPPPGARVDGAFANGVLAWYHARLVSLRCVGDGG